MPHAKWQKIFRMIPLRIAWWQMFQKHTSLSYCFIGLLGRFEHKARILFCRSQETVQLFIACSSGQCSSGQCSSPTGKILTVLQCTLS